MGWYGIVSIKGTNIHEVTHHMIIRFEEYFWNTKSPIMLLQMFYRLGADRILFKSYGRLGLCKLIEDSREDETF